MGDVPLPVLSRLRLLRWVPLAIYAAAILWATSHQAPAVLAAVNDKVLHAIEYGLFAALALLALGGWGPRRPQPGGFVAWWRVLAALLLSVAFGAVDEWRQSLSTARISSAADVAADAVGALLVLGVSVLAARRPRATTDPA